MPVGDGGGAAAALARVAAGEGTRIYRGVETPAPRLTLSHMLIGYLRRIFSGRRDRSHDANAIAPAAPLPTDKH